MIAHETPSIGAGKRERQFAALRFAIKSLIDPDCIIPALSLRQCILPASLERTSSKRGVTKKRIAV
ncbi:hypothetical protein [Bradyrhizobium macuxiense]|uniref:hypothetical protein n=1 Tax=Bradyrhizobium macuxiense TaxID=1755647 RepID=UPI0011BFE16F|nr:hypothetical protein [Bradyrhizobium macuxiense]